MHNDGFLFRKYVESHKLNKTQLAKKLGMSKQNIYQLFKSRKFEPDTIAGIEKIIGVKWKDIKDVNIVVNIEGEEKQTNGAVVNEPEVPYGRAYLEESVRNLSETEKINARNIERLISLLEFKIGFVGQPDLPEPGQEGTAMAVKNKSGHKDRT